MNYNRIWDKAREHRPSIYTKPQLPLTEEVYRSKTDCISLEEFRMFYRKLVEVGKPTDYVNIYEFFRLISLNQHSLIPLNLDKNSLSSDTVTTHTQVLRCAFSFRNIFFKYEKREETIEAMVFDALERFKGYVKYFHKFFLDDDHPAFISKISELILKKYGREISISYDEIWLAAIIISYNVSSPPPYIRLGTVITSSDIYSDILISKRKLKKLMDYYDSMDVSRGNYDWFRYPVFESRFAGILHREHVIIPEDCISIWLRKEGSKLYGKKSRVMIAMYPWEADHLDKAREMQRRGILVAPPLGHLFLGDIEFALFGFVPGIPLIRVSEPYPWYTYGKFVRDCYQRGIVLDDAAGRNAIWTGSKIVGIDFEHTWLTKEVKPVRGRDRRVGLERVKKELDSQKKLKLLDAFFKGYKEK